MIPTLLPQLSTQLHNRFAETLGWTLLHSLWQLSLLAALAAAALALLRRAAANTRYLLASLSLLLMLALPIATFCYLLPAPLATAPANLPFAHYTPAPETPAAISTPATRSPTPTPLQPLPLSLRLKHTLEPCLPAAVILYFLGTSLMLLRLLLGYARLRRILARAQPLHGTALHALQTLARRMHIRQSIRLLQSAAIEVPTLIGALQPVILLPASALTGLSPDQLSALLAHELAHIRRYDYFFNLAQSAIETLLFYHPAVWWLGSRIRLERELCCDDAAIAATANRLAYARALATMESLRTPAHPALAATGTGGSLLHRITRILGTTPQHQPSRMLTTTIAALALAFSAALAYVGCNRSDLSTFAPQTAALTQPETGKPTPYADLMVYPSNWPDITRNSAPNRAAEAKLDATAHEFSVEKTDLETALKQLRDAAHVNILVKWGFLQFAGVDRHLAVTMRVKESTYREILNAYLAQADNGRVPLGYLIDDGVVLISTRDDLNSLEYEYMRVYDERDLLALPANTPKTRDQLVSDLIASIKTSVAPNSWRDNGGTIGSIRELNGQLVVNQTHDNQRAIFQLLQKIRGARGLSTQPRDLFDIGADRPTTTVASTTSTSLDNDRQHRVGQEVTRQSIDTNEHLIPYADLMVYPDNWPEITRKRGGGESSQDSPANRAVRDRLEENLKKITAEAQGLEKVLNFLRDNMGANIFVNWTALAAVNVDRNTPVSVSLKEVPFRKALTTILSQVGGGTANLSYTIDDGIITISTKEDLSSAKYQLIKVFDVHDLLVPANTSKTRDQLASDLIASIKSNVAPDSWRDNGGTIRELNGQLIVNQTLDNQSATFQFLLKIRGARGLSTQPRELFDIGADRPTTTGNSTQPARLSNTPASAPATATKTLASDQILVKAVLANLDDSQLQMMNDAFEKNKVHPAGPLMIGGMKGDDKKDFAADLDPKSILSRPQVLLNDGQEGVITIGQEVPFIKGFHDDPAKGRVADIDYQLAGFKLSLRATLVAPADAAAPRTVKLDIDATWSELLPTATVPATSPDLPIQGPVLERRHTQTTATVADNTNVILLLPPAATSKNQKGMLLILMPHVGTITSAPAK